jgi:hypothetical protein
MNRPAARLSVRLAGSTAKDFNDLRIFSLADTRFRACKVRGALIIEEGHQS